MARSPWRYAFTGPIRMFSLALGSNPRLWGEDDYFEAFPGGRIFILSRQFRRHILPPILIFLRKSWGRCFGTHSIWITGVDSNPTSSAKAPRIWRSCENRVESPALTTVRQAQLHHSPSTQSFAISDMQAKQDSNS
jgi:hypothetical protein